MFYFIILFSHAVVQKPLKLVDVCSQVIYLTARMDTVRKCSISARTWLERCTVRARNWHDLGSKEYLLGLETGTIWARKRHELSSKQTRFRLENGTIWARSWHANTQSQGSKISKFGTKNRFHHFGWVKFCSNTTKNIIKSKKQQIKCLNLEYMIYGIGALHSSRLV